MSDNGCGYIKLYRKLRESWQGSKPEWWLAWTWLLVEARGQDCPKKDLKRGQLWFSIYWAKEKWNMTAREAQYFLTRCEKEGDITWERGVRGRRKQHENYGSGTGSGTGSECGSGMRPRLGRITITNYDKYNPLCPSKGSGIGSGMGSEIGSNSVAFLNKRKEKKIKENTVPLSGVDSGPSQQTPKPKAPKKLEDIQTRLSEINISDFIREYEPQGLDVTKCFDNFSDYVLNGTPSKPFSNPSNWRDFNKAFHNSCKMAIQKGWHQIRAPVKEYRDPAHRYFDD